MPEFFTRQEAEALLPTVEPLLREAQLLVTVLRATRDRAHGVRAHALGNGHLQGDELVGLQDQASATSDALKELLGQVSAFGVLVKDPASGLIDFPTLRAGREVYLCWRLGEGETIGWWHEVDAGIAGRQPFED